MKLTPTATLAALCWTARLASAATGYVYIIDSSHTEQPRRHQGDGGMRSLDPISARLVLAQRAGVEDYHSADLSSEGAIEAINEYGLRTPLFGAGDARRRAMVLVEGTRDPEAEMPSLSNYTSFALTPTPDASVTRGLWIDLAKQAQPSIYSHFADSEAVAKMGNHHDLANRDIVFYIASSMADFQEIMSRFEITTAYFSPPSQDARKDNGKVQWGSYTMPNTQSSLRKRESQGRQQQEEPLEYTKPPSSDNFEAAEAAKAVFESFGEPISAFASNSTPLPGILPSCFTSQAQCETQTRNCTGHGTCFKKFTDASAQKESRTKDCYSCGCSATQQTTSDGKTKTTYWGGPACQKKDVSVQFWLLALFAVAMMFLIGFAVGEIQGMGDLELPSVIGAGVSGPVKR